ncbi:DMT family transporter [Noviherbaspirillum malthae]|uniref:DMT family transporter n=1 Tax=Noviherbaspirillum malthae TaxID=1260987 RepID=UPI00188FECDB|nr:DMT family transporter [Noviherbaspirillum malthae]
MDARKALDGQAVGIMVVLCIVWGMQQVALKATAADISPSLQISIRSGIAAVLVGVVMIARKERISFAQGMWRPGLIVGILFALEYLFVGAALRHTSAAHTAVFLYTAPVFAALGLHWKMPAERLAPLQWIGIAVAFAGIVMAFLGRGGFTPGGSLSHVSETMQGDLLALAAGISMGATNVVIRCSSLSRAPATETLLYQLLGAFVLLLFAAATSGELTINPTPSAWGGLIFQTLIVSFASFLVWFWLLRHYLASRLGVLSFMTPIFGVVLGAWLLNEAIEPGFLAGALLVLAGIALVSGYEWLQGFRGAAR